MRERVWRLAVRTEVLANAANKFGRQALHVGDSFGSTFLVMGVVGKLEVGLCSWKSNEIMRTV
jgi:hypothetical protein